MKTFTLRLTDNEAAALETIAFFKGVSKNKALEKMIACEYEYIDDAAVYDEEIVFITPPEDIALYGGLPLLHDARSRAEILEAIQYFDYGIERHSGKGKHSHSKEELMELKEKALVAFREIAEKEFQENAEKEYLAAEKEPNNA